MVALQLQLQGMQLRPELYAEASYERPGYLAATGCSTSKLWQQQQQRRHALNRLASHRSAAAAAAQQAERQAAAQDRQRLRRRGLAALRYEVAAARQRNLAADRQRSKWLYVRFAACWAAWRTATATRRRMAAKAVEAAVLRRRALAAKALAVLQQQVTRGAAKRHRWATADCFSAFCLLAHSLDSWQASLERRTWKQQQLAAGVFHWAARMCYHALAAWHRRTRDQLLRQHRCQLAFELHRRIVLSTALAAWLELARRLHELRAVAEVTIERALWGSQQHVGHMCLLGWQARNRHIVQLRDSTYLAARLRRYSLLSKAWSSWMLWSRWRWHLQQLQCAMQALEPRLVLHCALKRWQAAAHAAQADDGGMCYRGVQLPRAFEAWKQGAQQQAELRLLGEDARQLLACRCSRRVLAGWRTWTAGKLVARGKKELAAAAWAECLRRTAFMCWRQAVQRKAARRARLEQAEVHWAARSAGASLSAWQRLANLRCMSGDWRQCYLLCHSFCGWRLLAQHTAYKAARWRQAVRQHYLRQLWAALEAWRRYQQRQQQKEARLQAMRRQRQARMLRCCLTSWSGPFLAVARTRRPLAQLVASHCASRLLRQVLSAWLGPFLVAARQCRRLLQAANSHRQAALQRQALGAWQGWVELRAEKHQQVATAAVLMRPARLKSLLAVWRHWCIAMVQKRAQAVAAEAMRRRGRLLSTWTAWQAHVERRQQRCSQWCRALLFSGWQQQQRAFAMWRAAQDASLQLPVLSCSEARGTEEKAAGGSAAASRTDATALVLAKLRRLQGAAQQATASPADAAVSPVAPQPQWRGASIANLPTASGLPGRAAVEVAPTAGGKVVGRAKGTVALPGAIHREPSSGPATRHDGA